MPLPLDDDGRALADAVAGLAQRHAPVARTREQLPDLAGGALPDCWSALVDNGLHALHLSEEHGGDDAGLAELAVVAEQLGRALVPGPWLPTVSASAVVAALATAEPVAGLLRSFGAGDTGALVTTPGLAAVPAGDGWTINGTTGPVLGIPGADHVVVRAHHDREPLWFVLPGAALAAPGVAGGTAVVAATDPVDQTRPLARLVLERYVVEPEQVLPTPPAEYVDLVTATLFGAESAGIASWALDTTVEHIRSRVQFDRPVGSFQAVQHRAAMMLVHTEIACAAAWDAARAQTHSAEQQRLAAAQSVLTAVPTALDVVIDCVGLLGAIGFTWEHDAHLYWRRGIALASLVGTEEQAAARLGTAALTGRRDFAFVDADELPELRAQVRGVLDRVLDLPDSQDASEAWAAPQQGARRQVLAGAGLVSPHYPRPYGLGAGPREQAVIAEEFATRDLTQPTTVIGQWVLPTILVHGTEEQQDRFVRPTLTGELVWCQLFSEPGAGSDLAGLATRARKVDGGWSLKGQKVWTSMAHQADWGVCLARTDAEVAKHKGLSYFLVDMRSAGVDVRPLRQATGRSEFNEVFLDDVFVPDDCLVAGPGEGWRLATTTLANERLSMGTQLAHGSSDRVRSLLVDGTHGGSREEALRALGRNTGREMALSALNLRSVLGRLADLDVGAEISVQKVFNAIAQRDGSRAILSLLGPAGATLEGGHAIDHIGLPAVLFGGGTIEIQLNVIAQRVLGLPR
ncbi:MAG: acyl-CoA dehydrogenase [Nocardioides sp.]|nr:acyl-CoA dehydrogenase [Nocardioides sp.]